MVTCSLVIFFFFFWFSAMVSVCCKEEFLSLMRGESYSVYGYQGKYVRNYAGLVK